MSDTVDVIVGTVGRPHGVRGEVTVLSRTDDPGERFAAGQRMRTGEGRGLTVSGTRNHQGALLVRFEQVRGRGEAEALRGLELWQEVPADAMPPDEGDYYDRHLIGLAARNPMGERLGTVTAVLHLPAQDVLAIETATGERLVPFVADLVPEVDVDHGYLVVTPIPGLLDDLTEDADED